MAFAVLCYRLSFEVMILAGGNHQSPDKFGDFSFFYYGPV